MNRMALSHGCLSRLVMRDIWTSGIASRGLAASAVALRKTRWMPTAPSKLYRVPERPVVPVDEMKDMKRLYNNYRTAMKSLKSYLRHDWELRQSNRAQPGHVLSPEQEEAEHRQLMAFNDAENARMAAEAEQRLAEQTEAVRRKVAALQQAALEQQEKDSRRAVELIRTQEEISRMYIPRDKLEEEIEKALADEVDYNYAIDKDGTRYEGRLARPS